MDTDVHPARRRSGRPVLPPSGINTRDTREVQRPCVHCRKHRLKCDSERPECALCLSEGIPCEYDEATRTVPARAAAAGMGRKRPAPISTYAQIKESRQRKRAAAAQTSCDFCRNDLRRKCDGLRPSCQSCIKRGEPCVYSGPASIPMTASSSTTSLPNIPKSDDEESDVQMPSRSQSPDTPVVENLSPVALVDANRPRYPQGNGLGHAGSTRNPDGTNCTRPVACFFCIKVEIPCTGDFPTCVNCVRRNLTCTYPEPSSYAHQFPRQSAMHTRQLKDIPSPRGSGSGSHTSPGHSQLMPQPTLHTSRSHPGPLNQNYVQHTPTPPSMSASPDSARHSRQRSISGPNGLPPFSSEIIRSGLEISRAGAGHRPPSSATSPSRPPNPNHNHSRNSSVTTTPSISQSTLPNSNPSYISAQASQLHSHPASTPRTRPRSPPNLSITPNQSSTPSERSLDAVRGTLGDARSPVDGAIASPTGRTRDTSSAYPERSGSASHAHSRSGSGGGIGAAKDGVAHDVTVPHRARLGEVNAMGPNSGQGQATSANSGTVLETARVEDISVRNGLNGVPLEGSLNKPIPYPPIELRVSRTPVQTRPSTETRQREETQRTNPGSAPPVEGRSESVQAQTASAVVLGGIPAKTTQNAAGQVDSGSMSRTGSLPLIGPGALASFQPPGTSGPGTGAGIGVIADSNLTSSTPTRLDVTAEIHNGNNDPNPGAASEDMRSKQEDLRGTRVNDSRRLSIPIPQGVSSRPIIPSPIIQPPARDMTISAQMGNRQDMGRRDSNSGAIGGRYDPRRDVGIEERDRWERSNWPPAPRPGGSGGGSSQPPRSGILEPRPLPPPLDIRIPNANSRGENSPHTPRNPSLNLPLEQRGAQARERSPVGVRKGGAGSPAVGPGAATPQNNRSRAGSRRRSQSPRGVYLRAESGSMRSSPMDMDSN